MLKQEPKISEFSSEVNPITGELRLTFKIIDINQALNSQIPLTISLYDMQDREFQKEVKLSDINKVVFKLPRNGSYRVKIFGHTNRGPGDNYKETQLFEQELVVESIDKSNLKGQDAIIKEGETFDPFKKLHLKALDINGEDITSNIIIDGEVNTKIPGIYSVTVSVVTSNQKIIQKIFNVEIQKIETEIHINQLNSSVTDLVGGEEFPVLLDATISKEYVDIERVIFNDIEYQVQKINQNVYQIFNDIEYQVQKINQNVYQILLTAPLVNGDHKFELTKIILSNGEEIEVNETFLINVMNIVSYQESIDFLSQKNQLSLSDGIANRISQNITGSDNQQYSPQLKINGQVTSENGELPSGQISISLPSKVNFVVDQDGNLHGSSNMIIKNNSLDVDITVSVVSFLDSTPMGGITVVNSNELKDKDRSFVSLSLAPSGGQKPETVTLLSEGFIQSKLVDIESQSQVGLVLTGAAGKNSYQSSTIVNRNKIDIDNQGISDQFILTFQIKKNN